MDLIDSIERMIRRALRLPEDPDSLPRVDRLALYRARVDACAADGSTVDVTPLDNRLEAAQHVPLRPPLPGAVVVVQAGAVVLLGWTEGDPARPFALPAWVSGNATKIVIPGSTVIAGAESGAQFVALAESLLQRIENIELIVDTHVHAFTGVAGAGACSGTTIQTFTPTAHAPPFAASQVKAK